MKCGHCVAALKQTELSAALDELLLVELVQTAVANRLQV